MLLNRPDTSQMLFMQDSALCEDCCMDRKVCSNVNNKEDHSEAGLTSMQAKIESKVSGLFKRPDFAATTVLCSCIPCLTQPLHSTIIAFAERTLCLSDHPTTATLLPCYLGTFAYCAIAESNTARSGSSPAVGVGLSTLTHFLLEHSWVTRKAALHPAQSLCCSCCCCQQH